ncbi:MAG: Rrf2 family transcriptional regulator [Candidatus Methanoplasma sp.]|jgi:Rrf2 family protein|nr:Rrf2 family transcriptional regulator [Candidatus Methanoplasma sp.]
MRISTKGRYALRMMIDVAENSKDGKVTIREISLRQGISVKYLEQIATVLTHAELLRSERGSQGGYVLTKTPEKYTAGEILHAIEGKLAPVVCLESEINTCERANTCKTVRFWEGLYKAIDEYLDSVTLQDLVIQNLIGTDPGSDSIRSSML